MIFSSLDLAPGLLKALNECGYRQMTPIQEKAIIPARRGKDLLASAQTGTGKTAAFTLPILQQMHDKPRTAARGKPRTLILTPTRELTAQLNETVAGYAQFLTLKIVAIHGGVGLHAQKKKLNTDIDIIISTPGRLLEHVIESNISLSQVEFVVLDEADRMLDMGFISDVLTLLQKTKKHRQTLLFSATLSQPVKELAAKILNKHVEISVARQNAIADTIEHVAYPVEEHRKPDLFIELLNQHNWFKVLVFTSTREQANQLMRHLKQAKITAALCHGEISQGARRRAMASFKSAKVQVLVATEVAARGLDIQELDHVVNYNLPYLAEDYVHRVGRTGRAGEKGQAISLVSREEERSLANIEKLINERITRVKIPGYGLDEHGTLPGKQATRRQSSRSKKTSTTRKKQTNKGQPRSKRRTRN